MNNEQKNHNNTVTGGAFVALIIIALVVIGIVYFFNQKQKSDDCHERALAAAIDTYPVDSHPNADVREIWQKDYIRKYEQSCQ